MLRVKANITTSIGTRAGESTVRSCFPSCRDSLEAEGGVQVIEWTMAEDEGIKPEHRRDYISGIFQETTYGEDSKETGVVDMLADLMHFCDLENIDFDKSLRIAKVHFREEKKGGDDGGDKAVDSPKCKG
jgi:hypothetical protein